MFQKSLLAEFMRKSGEDGVPGSYQVSAPSGLTQSSRSPTDTRACPVATYWHDAPISTYRTVAELRCTGWAEFDRTRGGFRFDFAAFSSPNFCPLSRPAE